MTLNFPSSPHTLSYAFIFLCDAAFAQFFGPFYVGVFTSMEDFKRELVKYLAYYNNRRLKAKLKGLPPAIHRQQPL